MALLAALHKGAALLAALREDLGHAFRKGKPFPASGPSAPAGRGRRAEKAACDFADARLLVRGGSGVFVLFSCF